ncbi:MAG: class D beta-lactamase [Marinilabiliales bacterium]|nr:MAG: class D beta-lactamase [Marinilabiliales bacterium]
MLLRINLLLIIISLLVSSCSEKPVVVRDDFKEIFTDNGFNGAFVLYNHNKNQWVYYNSGQCKLRFPPASTFKILSALILLEENVVDGPDYEIKWDSTKYEIDEWNKNHTLKSAIENSVVWYFDKALKNVDSLTIANYLDSIDYGNHLIGKLNKPFWLYGDLKISPEEQIEFLRKFYNENLPFSAQNIKTVKNLILSEKTNEYSIYTKTGTCPKYKLGWYIGFIEKNNNVYYFATTINGKTSHKRFNFARLNITRRILSILGIL